MKNFIYKEVDGGIEITGINDTIKNIIIVAHHTVKCLKDGIRCYE